MAVCTEVHVMQRVTCYREATWGPLAPAVDSGIDPPAHDVWEPASFSSAL